MSFLIAGRNLLLSFSHQGRVLHPPNCGFVVGHELQWLLASIFGAAFSVGWAVFLIPRGRILFLCYVGDWCVNVVGRPLIGWIYLTLQVVYR